MYSMPRRPSLFDLRCSSRHFHALLTDATAADEPSHERTYSSSVSHARSARAPPPFLDAPEAAGAAALEAEQEAEAEQQDLLFVVCSFFGCFATTSGRFSNRRTLRCHAANFPLSSPKLQIHASPSPLLTTVPWVRPVCQVLPCSDFAQSVPHARVKTLTSSPGWRGPTCFSGIFCRALRQQPSSQQSRYIYNRRKREEGRGPRRGAPTSANPRVGLHPTSTTCHGASVSHN